MKKLSVMILSAALLLSAALPCRAASLPAKYDLRKQGRITGVKDQGSEHTFCWAFATLASLESSLITQGIAEPDIDLSEAHLACFMLNPKSSESAGKYAGKDAYYHSGDATNFYTAAALLARGYGAVTEKTMPYSLYDGSNMPGGKYLTEKMRTKSQYELKQAVFVQVNNTLKKYDQAAYRRIKQLIMKNGAVASKIYFPGFYDWKTVFGTTNPNQIKTYYCEEEMADHAVTIVGWDDTFRDFQSKNKPKGPGAWIVKDSYGTDLHGDGYMYVSYYSPCISQAVSFVGQKSSGKECYQYDGTGIGDYMLIGGSETAGANCFTARSDILLDQVMTFTPEDNCRVNIQIYAANDGSSPVSGVRLYNKTFTKKQAGYSRTDLGKQIGIPGGASFSILVSVKTPSGRYFIPFELQDVANKGASPAVIQSGQSYIQLGSSWQGITVQSKISDGEDTYRLYNALVKGFGTKAGKTAQKISAKSSLEMKKGAKLSLNAVRTTGTGKLIYESSDPEKAAVSQKGVVTANKKGTVKITVYSLPSAQYKSGKKTVEIRIR